MKNHICLTILTISCLFLASCTKSKTETPFDCKEITLGETFIAKFGEEWCVPQTGWKMTFGPFIEDGRCNITDIVCVWEGQFVMGATFDDGTETVDTFYAITNWRDTLINGSHTIILNKIYPLIRDSFAPVDLEDYSFEMIVE